MKRRGYGRGEDDEEELKTKYLIQSNDQAKIINK
jgi:hypothetical protein